MTLQEKIGQKLMAGFPGKEMSPEFIRLVKDYKVGNVILFQHNVENIEQLSRLCREIQALVAAETGHPAIIGIDQEGGGVTRLPQDAVNVPGAMALAATGDPKNAYLAAKITAAELRALGICCNAAPVADINNNPDNSIIGIRSYGDTPKQVTSYVKEALRGYLDGGIMPGVKHFPGHGDTDMDSHVSLPMIDKSLEELEKMELIPFRAAIEAGCPCVMTTHILFPQIEPDKVPATMSRRIITGLLRERMGFSGIVVSDCMEMDAIAKYYGTVKGAVAAMEAGVDIVLVSHSVEKAKEAAIAMCRAVESGRMPEEELDASIERIMSGKKRYCKECEGTAGTAEAMARSARLRKKSITLYQGEIPPMGANPLFVGCADYRAGQVSNVETNQNTFAGYMASVFGGEAHVTSRDPKPEEIEKTAIKAATHSAVFVNTYNGHLFRGQMALVRRLAELGIPMAVVALRNPYDLRGLPREIAAVAAWDYSQYTLELLVPVLAGRERPQGHMPVDLVQKYDAE